MHLKRMKANMKWPVARKGTKFLVRPLGEMNNGIPLLIVLRDMLKIGSNRSEIKQILNSGNIEVNGKIRRNEKLAVKTFDVIIIKSLNKIYSLHINKSGRFAMKEEKDSSRIGKVIGKKMLKSGKVQINLNTGDNFISKENIQIGDSLIIDKNGKITKVVQLKEGSKVAVISGKHIGMEGKIKEIMGDVAKVAIDNAESNIKMENLMAI